MHARRVARLLGVGLVLASLGGCTRRGGRPDLWVQAHGDEEAIPEVRRSFAGLSRDGLMDPLVDR